ncbi:uncharacterized protein LOC124905977 isoform X1 [Homo sapiens]|uniref:uncharacterized protein LOC124905977 isoform X1 n=1 Tax=Homo sapiens TaxID=9606 RepID=UPI001FB13D9A|nr:uncharacterized protein LOC124905977 isoform X1 [Homo sapiens]XP_047302513.1 uncharacterized protein LOC124905977 isoform X1 [Homo sapiens]
MNSIPEPLMMNKFWNVIEAFLGSGAELLTFCFSKEEKKVVHSIFVFFSWNLQASKDEMKMAYGKAILILRRKSSHGSHGFIHDKVGGLFVCLRIPAMLPSVALPPWTVTVSPSSFVYMTLIALRSTGLAKIQNVCAHCW